MKIKPDFKNFFNNPIHAIYCILKTNMTQYEISRSIDSHDRISPIGTSYLVKFQKRAVTNLKNYLTKNYEKLRKSKGGQ